VTNGDAGAPRAFISIGVGSSSSGAQWDRTGQDRTRRGGGLRSWKQASPSPFDRGVAANGPLPMVRIVRALDRHPTTIGTLSPLDLRHDHRRGARGRELGDPRPRCRRPEWRPHRGGRPAGGPVAIDVRNIRSDDLRYLLAVARTGRRRSAALDLGVDHTTVSRRIRALQGRCWVSVCCWELTDVGRSIAEKARLIEEAVQETVYVSSASGRIHCGEPSGSPLRTDSGRCSSLPPWPSCG
jgi:hypothetical protein